MEYHPRINIEDKPLTEYKIILGSFPTWTLTTPNLLKNETAEEKEYYRDKNGDVPFFYGSSVNKFWLWYRSFIDPSVLKTDIGSIQNSLKKNRIGITDTIFQCVRKNKSSLDNDLKNRLYNHQFFKYPDKHKKIKILCTSKGVMNEMLLNKTFFSIHDRLKIDQPKSNVFQEQIISNIGGNHSKVKKPIYRFVNCKNGGILECLAIPSPGSPYRGLNAFGLNNSDTDKYLNNYLEQAFEWFIS